MNPLRVAILVALAGAILWVFAPAVVAAMIPQPVYKYGAISEGPWAGTQTADCIRNCDHDGVARTVGSTSRTTIVIVAIAGVAWVLAGMVKSKV